MRAGNSSLGDVAKLFLQGSKGKRNFFLSIRLLFIYFHPLSFRYLTFLLFSVDHPIPRSETQTRLCIQNTLEGLLCLGKHAAMSNSKKTRKKSFCRYFLQVQGNESFTLSISALRPRKKSTNK